MGHYIPTKVFTTRSSDPHWWTVRLQSAQLLKRQRRSNGRSGGGPRSWMTSRPPALLLSTELSTHSRSLICLASIDCATHSAACQSLSDKQWWTTMKKATGVIQNSASVPLLVDSHGQEYHTSAEKAECLPKHFSSKCTQGDQELTVNDLPAVTTPTHEPLEHVHFREATVQRYRARLVPSKASIPNCIPSQVWKECCKELAAPITKLVSASFGAGVVPSQWKLAHVVPVHKKPPRSFFILFYYLLFPKGRGLSPSNYRPVPLLSIILSKVMESIINQQVTNFLERNPLLSDSQLGFRRGGGTADLLTSLQSAWVQIVAQGGGGLYPNTCISN